MKNRITLAYMKRLIAWTKLHSYPGPMLVSQGIWDNMDPATKKYAEKKGLKVIVDPRCPVKAKKGSYTLRIFIKMSNIIKIIKSLFRRRELAPVQGPTIMGCEEAGKQISLTNSTGIGLTFEFNAMEPGPGLEIKIREAGK